MPAPLPRSSGHGFEHARPAPRAAVVGIRDRFERCCPSGNTSATALPANSRWQLATIASNTGCVSVTEPLMTRRISAVAVCRSSASLVSLNSRAFWIAITAWSANVLSSASSLSREGLRRLAQHADRADAAVFPQHRRPRRPSSCRSGRRRCGTRGRRVAASPQRPRMWIARRSAIDPRRSSFRRAACGNVRATASSADPRHARRVHLAVVARRGRCRAARCANRCCAAVEDLVEHRRGVRHRAADHLQHLGGGGLLLQRLLASR